MAILTLPTEILVEIFAGVPQITDILTCRCVFCNVIKTSIRLNYYRIELERAGMINNPH
jgi:DNA gyrase inhibitor GyrI